MSLPKDLLERLQKALEDTPSKAYKPSKQTQDRKAKRAAKQAELREGGRRAAERDWVRHYDKPGGISSTTRQEQTTRPGVKPPKLAACRCPKLVEHLTNPPGRPKREPVPAPVPTAERSVEELYKLLAERWRRYQLVVAEDKPDKGKALENVLKVAELLEERGQTEEQILSFIDSLEGGETNGE